ncbi:MAG: hypothetical protein A2901_02465 [Elusimicrobia bacterium RIFCSPLOWO2_01_FULL_54_10]|nr:MAG: hypothetical protein A2901_02465 [Elusimicrobia bacterium RIFCSPLOWO2_01_FULL_54_10]
MTKTERAYLAGLIDGEGTITLTRNSKSQHPQPQVSIANNNLRILKWVRSKMGMGSLLTKMPKKATHNVAYTWQVNRAGGSFKVLRAVYPYLRVKKRQAAIILNEYPRVTPRNGKYDPKTLAQKFRLVRKIQSLNSRQI